MKRENVSRIIGHIDEKYVNEATVFASDGDHGTIARNSVHAEKSEKSPRRSRWAAMAACLALIAIIGSAAFGFAAEATEYKNAVTFFEENGLSMEGLSRSEVKAVYRDITQKEFSYDKTADVIRQAVPGWEIRQHEPTPEELSVIWDKNVWRKSISEKGISYRTGS